jgi:hypothetical protein
MLREGCSRLRIARVFARGGLGVFGLLLLGCVPLRYTEEFPGGVEKVAPVHRFQTHEGLLLVPCWKMTGETDTFEYGPLALLQAEA